MGKPEGRAVAEPRRQGEAAQGVCEAPTEGGFFSPPSGGLIMG
jgi:hypothetical protein